jgi:hypothetical protein
LKFCPGTAVGLLGKKSPLSTGTAEMTDGRLASRGWGVLMGSQRVWGQGRNEVQSWGFCILHCLKQKTISDFD